MGGRLTILSISGGRGTYRNRFWSGNATGRWLFVIKRDLAEAAYRTVDDDFVEVVLQL